LGVSALFAAVGLDAPALLFIAMFVAG